MNTHNTINSNFNINNPPAQVLDQNVDGITNLFAQMLLNDPQLQAGVMFALGIPRQQEEAVQQGIQVEEQMEELTPPSSLLPLNHHTQNQNSDLKRDLFPVQRRYSF